MVSIFQIGVAKVEKYQGKEKVNRSSRSRMHQNFSHLHNEHFCKQWSNVKTNYEIGLWPFPPRMVLMHQLYDGAYRCVGPVGLENGCNSISKMASANNVEKKYDSQASYHNDKAFALFIHCVKGWARRT